MKYLPFILLIVILSCHLNDDKTLEYLNEGIERATSKTSILNEKFITGFDMAYQTNSKKTEPYKLRADKINYFSKAICNSIDERKHAILTKNSKDRTFQKEELFSNINNYKNLTDSIFPSNTIIQSLVQSLPDYNHAQSEELNLFQLNFIANKVKTINYLALKNLYFKIQKGTLRFNKTISAVIPKSKYLFPYENYHAELRLFAIDTIYEFIADFGEYTIKSNNGQVIYNDSNVLIPKVENKGVILRI